MHKKQQIINLVKEQGLVPLFYHDDAETCKNIVRALYDGGVRIIEFTNRGANARENFIALRELVNKELHGMLLGIGTIKSQKDALDFIAAGADFIVCPIMHEGIAKTTHEAGLLWIPGCLTSTEIGRAEELGASVVKIFPGSLVGPSYIGAMRDIFPGLNFMPTGGVELEKENIKGWFDAGVVAVGMGSKLITKKLLENKAYADLTSSAKQVLDIIQSVKK
jgi:2-dehydro-3-deoxyphosphogluconate aldolase/(4S)-4-hydroxy-2-oxoglutarate aldolase